MLPSVKSCSSPRREDRINCQAPACLPLADKSGWLEESSKLCPDRETYCLIRSYCRCIDNSRPAPNASCRNFAKNLRLKRSYIILLFFMAVCIGVLASQLGNVSSYAHFNDHKLLDGKEVRLKGTLAADQPVVYDPQVDPNSFTFYLVDSRGVEGKVVCYDEKPRDFEKSDEIVLTGSLHDSVFYANDLLVKCPSKYVDEEIEKKEI